MLPYSQHERRSGGMSEEMKERVLATALGHVSKHGWTSEALALAAAEHGLSPMAHGLFQRVRDWSPLRPSHGGRQLKNVCMD